jgi:predicted nucleic acid-binding protein
MLLRSDELLTSALTLGEIQVKALNQGLPELAQDLKRRVLATSRIIPFDTVAGDAFAYLRSTTNVKGADAVHLACAMATSVDFFITNDNDLQKLSVPGIGRIISAHRLPTA